MPLFIRLAQYFGFIFTETSNALLLYLIFTRASTRFGSYKYLMISYAVYSLVYALVEISTMPVIHVYGAGMYMYVDSFLKFKTSISNPLASAYCATYGLCISLLATQFVYRYCAVCRPHDLSHFEGWNLLKIYIIPTAVGIFWFFTYFLMLGPTEMKTAFIRKEIFKVYQEDMENVGYMAYLYYYEDEAGNLVINWSDIVMYFVPCGVMLICIITMTICGWKTYRKMNDVKKSMSQKTKELNNQLFTTLVFQTIVPMFTMFAPVGTILTLPIFSIGVHSILANAPTLNAGIYPGLDATIAIFMIRDFRDTVLCRKRPLNSSMASITPSAKHTSNLMS